MGSQGLAVQELSPWLRRMLQSMLLLEARDSSLPRILGLQKQRTVGYSWDGMHMSHLAEIKVGMEVRKEERKGNGGRRPKASESLSSL